MSQWGPRQVVRLVGEEDEQRNEGAFRACAETTDMEFARTWKV